MTWSVTVKDAFCVESVLRAVAMGLFDSPWLERCPALERVRLLPELLDARAVVQERARAVLAALRSEGATVRSS